MNSDGYTIADYARSSRHAFPTRVMQVACAHWAIGRSDIVPMPSPVTHTTNANGLELPFVVGTQTLLAAIAAEAR